MLRSLVLLLLVVPTCPPGRVPGATARHRVLARLGALRGEQMRGAILTAEAVEVSVRPPNITDSNVRVAGSLGGSPSKVRG